MKTRRDFVKLAATATLLGAASTRAAPPTPSPTPAASGTGADDRAAWCALVVKLATPVLIALAEHRLKATMPVEAAPGVKDRPQYTYLEALGRVLCGLAPWLELGGDESAEGRQRVQLADLARRAIEAGTDPASPDFLNFSKGAQPLVDSAFLAQAMLRAPNELWKKLSAPVQANVIAALQSSRRIQPGENNWKLFATTVEVFLFRAGATRDDARLFEGLRKHREWYVGDGMYGDGPEFHWDYYNSFVIQPMLVEALDAVGDEAPEWKSLREKSRERLTRWAAIQERVISPDGTYPIIGRSIAYRCGAFHGLALAALRHALPEAVTPAQTRVALTSVIRRTLEAPGVFDDQGWLRIGVSGHQPALGETYISTGSLYLCSAAFLPLGLPASDLFWSAPAAPTTWQKVWSGANLPADHAIKSPR
jgi:hypothetical protein